MDFQNKDTIVTHVETPIESHHFTPFATLLWQLPSAIKTVCGTTYHGFTWTYDYANRRVFVHVVRKINGGYTSDTVIFNRTAYSYAQIVETLSTSLLDG